MIFCLLKTVKNSKIKIPKTWKEPKKKKEVYPQRSHRSANSPVRRRQPFLVLSTNSLQLELKQTLPEGATDDDICSSPNSKKKITKGCGKNKTNRKAKRERNGNGKGKVFLVQKRKFPLYIARKESESWNPRERRRILERENEVMEW